MAPIPFPLGLNPLSSKSANVLVCSRNQLQSNPDFQDGKFDLDGLCSELRAKARCSESGVMVDQDHVDAALRKLGKTDDGTATGAGGPAGAGQAAGAGKGKFTPAETNPFTGGGQLMFEQESWDRVVRRMGGS